MSNYSWINAHFSPTGTTAKVARAVAQGSGCSVQEVDLSTSAAQAAVGPDEILLAGENGWQQVHQLYALYLRLSHKCPQSAERYACSRRGNAETSRVRA